jgi:tight adherence protein B
MVIAAAGTFVVVLTLILGTYWLVVLRPETRARAELHQRMTPRAPARKRGLLLARRQGEPAEGRAAPGVTRQALAPIQRRLTRAGMSMPAPTFVMLAAWIALLACGTLWVGTGRILAGLAGGAAALYVLYAIVTFKAGRRTWRFEEQFPEAVDLVARALRAGHAFPTAIGMVAAEVPDPVGGEFKKLYEQQNFGMSLPAALRAFADRVPVLDARFFVTAVLTQRESGGNLAGVLDNLAAVVRERFKVKRQVRVISAHGRMTAAILSALPPVLALMLTAISPAQMLPLIEDPMGPKMIAGAVGLQLVGMAIMRRIVNVEY